MQTYEDYLKKQREENAKQLSEQSAKSAATEANAAASAFASGVKAGSSMMSGGSVNPDMEYKPITVEVQQPASVPEKGHYNADAEVYEDLNAAAAEKAQADADLAAAQADLNAAREDHPMLDANKQPQVVAAPAVQPTTVATPATTPTVTAPASATVTAQAETTVDRSDAPVYNAAQTSEERDLAAAQAAYDKAEQETLQAVQDENAARNKSFADMVNDYYAEKKRQEDEMKQREQANMMSSMATGTTELAANIINMLSVGQLHANNQQYKSYSQDWMRKADQDIREHRHRRESLGNTLQRLKQQQAQVMAAGRLDDLKARQKKAADDLAAAQEAYNRQQKENEKKAAQDAAMLAKGFRPDPSDPSGYRFDPNLARQMAGARSTRAAKASGSPTAKKPASTPSQPKAGTNRTYAPNADGGERAPEGNRQQSYANTQTDTIYDPILQYAGFKDYAYRMPHQEGEWAEKPNVYGWDDRFRGSGFQEPSAKSEEKKTETDWSQYKVK